MANQEKAELKIELWTEEIQVLQKEILILDAQKENWRGASQAYSEAVVIVNSLFQTMKSSLDWGKLSVKEKNKQLKENSKAEPKITFTDDDAYKASLLLRPAQTLLTQKKNEAGQEPNRFEAQKSFVVRQIDRLQRLIKQEASKDFTGDAGEVSDEE